MVGAGDRILLLHIAFGSVELGVAGSHRGVWHFGLASSTVQGGSMCHFALPLLEWMGVPHSILPLLEWTGVLHFTLPLLEWTPYLQSLARGNSIILPLSPWKFHNSRVESAEIHTCRIEPVETP